MVLSWPGLGSQMLGLQPGRRHAFHPHPDSTNISRGTVFLQGWCLTTGIQSVFHLPLLVLLPPPVNPGAISAVGMWSVLPSLNHRVIRALCWERWVWIPISRLKYYFSLFLSKSWDWKPKVTSKQYYFLPVLRKSFSNMMGIQCSHSPQFDLVASKEGIC